MLRRRRQVREAPNYKRRGRWCLLHPGISPPPSVVGGGGLEQTRKSRVSPSSLSQYFIESMALASADVSQRCDNGKCVSGVVVKTETLRRDGRRQSNNGVHWPRKREKSWLVVSLVALSSLFVFVFFNITLFSCCPSFAISPQAVIPSTSG